MFNYIICIIAIVLLLRSISSNVDFNSVVHKFTNYSGNLFPETIRDFITQLFFDSINICNESNNQRRTLDMFLVSLFISIMVNTAYEKK